jgi:hypothetical protein
MRHALAAAAVLLLASCDGTLLFLELQIPELRVTLQGLSLPASSTSAPEDWCDPSGQSDPPCIAVTASYDLGEEVPALTQENVGYELRLTDVAMTLSSTSSGDHLGGVALMTLRVLDDPLSGLPGFVVATYARPGGAGEPTSLVVSGNANVDLGPYVRAGRLPLRVEVTLDAPTPALEADLAAGFSLVVTLDWGTYLSRSW